MKKKQTPKRKATIKPKSKAEYGESELYEIFDAIDFVALSFVGRFVLFGLFVRKAFACLLKGRATV